MSRVLEDPAFLERPRPRVSKEDWPPGYRRWFWPAEIDRFVSLVGVALGLLVLIVGAAGSPDSVLPAVGLGAFALGVANYVLGRMLGRQLPTWSRAVIYLLKAGCYAAIGALALAAGVVVLLAAAFFGAGVFGAAIVVLGALALAAMVVSSLPGDRG